VCGTSSTCLLHLALSPFNRVTNVPVSLLVNQGHREGNLVSLFPQLGKPTLPLSAEPMLQTTSFPISSASSNEGVQIFTNALSDATRQTITSFVVVGAAPAVLTTFFTPPSECLGGAWTSNISAYGALVCTRAYTPSCFPSGFLENRNALYSPGVCPQGCNPGTMFSTPTTPMVTSCVCCPS
jgi:hypothetical protein